MIKYRMYERELTGGNTYQDHIGVDKFEEYSINLDKYGLGRTSKNETSPHDYIHIFATGEYVQTLEQHVLDFFDIPVNFPITYLGRKVPFTSEFRCGFSLETYETFNSTYYQQTLLTNSMFKGLYSSKGLYNTINVTGDFTKDGDFIDDSINIEFTPNQTKETYEKVKQIITETYGANNFTYPDSLFDNKIPDLFHFKIRYGINGLVIKFYNLVLNES